MVGDDPPRGVPRAVVSGLFRLRVGLVQEPLLLEAFAAIGGRDVAVNLVHVGSVGSCWFMLVHGRALKAASVSRCIWAVSASASTFETPVRASTAASCSGNAPALGVGRR